MRGFTLVESIAVILVIGVLAAISAVFVVQPFTAARDMTRRAELVDAAETALNRMTREIRLAVPNSVRIDGNTIEFLRTSTGGRYRRLLDSDDPSGSDALDPTGPTDTFDVLAGLPGEVTVGTAGRNCADEATGPEDCIVVNNTGTTGFDVYNGDNVAAVRAADGNNTNDAVVANPQTLTFDTGGGTAAFPAHSANQRFQVIDTVVSYDCTGSRINRHHDYGLNPTQIAPPPATDGFVNLLARDVIACEFTYSAEAGQRHGLVTIDITLQRDGETVRLVDQTHVVNVP